MLSIKQSYTLEDSNDNLTLRKNEIQNKRRSTFQLYKPCK